MADPLVAARVARDGSLTLSQPEIQGVSGFNGGAISGGNTLKSEKADTISFGVVWNPSFNRFFEPFVISVDYFDIDIDDGISSIGRGTALTYCYTEAASYDPSSPFCQNIERWDSGPFLGALRYINAYQQNLSKQTTKGIDVQANYELELADMFKNINGDPGRLNLGVNYTYVDELSTVSFPGAEKVDDAGIVGVAEHKAVFSAVYYRQALTLAADLQYIGKSDLDSSGFWEGPKIGAQAFLDLQARYQVTDHFEFVAGADNVFDDFVELGFSAPATSTGWNTASDVYDALGRRFYFGAKAKF